jgi:DNA-binding MarR family transcriptional regulator
MRQDEAQALTVALLAAAAALVDGVQAGVAARGYDDVRPTHGFAFARLATNGATVSELAVHLGMTKQAASQLVEELVAKGYVERRLHPDDARARLVVLSQRGWACTRAADQAAAETVRSWAKVLGERRMRDLIADLAKIAPHGPLRPAAW